MNNFYYRSTALQQPYTPEVPYSGCGHCGSSYGSPQVDELEILQTELANVVALLQEGVPDQGTQIALQDERTVLQNKIETIQNTQFRQKGMNVLSYIGAFTVGAYAYYKSECPVVTAFSAYGALCGSHKLLTK